MAVDFTAISFLGCALAYAALAVLLRPARFGRGAPRFRLRIASLSTAVAAILAWWGVRIGVLGWFLAHSLAIALLSVWIWQLEPLARWQGQPRWFQQMLRWSGPLGLLIIVGVVAFAGGTQAWDGLASRFSIGGLLLAVLGLFAIEQIYLNAPKTAVGAIRWMCLGFGGVFAAVLVVFAQSLLFGGLLVEPWIACGVMFSLSAAAIARGALQMPDWSFGLSISRQVAFYSTSFVAIGGYLVVLSIGGWLLLNTSVEWSRWAQSLFAAAAALMLMGLLFSTSLLRWLRAFINKHFYPQRYDYRLEWLRLIRTLSDDRGGAGIRERSIRAVAQLVESPSAVLWSREGDKFRCTEGWRVSTSGQVIDAHDELPAFLLRTTWLIDLAELQHKRRRYDGLVLDAQRYDLAPDGLIVPLLHIDKLYGWLVLERPTGMMELTFEDRDLLKTAGRQIAAYLVQHDADAELAEARQFEAYNRMTAFVMHDLKNIAAQLRLISQNADRHKRNPDFIDDAMRTIGASAGRMTKLIAQLANGESGTMRTADLADVAERAAVRCSSGMPVPQVGVQARPTVFADIERLSSVIEHAIRNAQDATPPTGEVRIEVDCVDAQPVIRIIDTGCGMDEAFVRERLFRPFDTTKGTKGMGIGAFQIREFLRSLGGSVQVQSAPGAGTTFSLIFPSMAQPEARLTG